MPDPVPPQESRSLTRNDLDLLMVVIFWGLNLAIAKLALAELAPLAFNGVRFGAAAALLAVIHFMRPHGPATSRSEGARMLLLGVVGHTAYQLFFIEGIARTTAAHAALIFGLTPVLVSLLSLALGHESIRPVHWAGTTLAFGGVYVIIAGLPPGEGPAPSLTGDLLILAATACWAVYTVLSRPLLLSHSPLKITAVTMAWGAVFLTPVCIPSILSQEWLSVSAVAWAATVYGVLFPLVFAYLLWYRSLRSVGSVRTAVYSNLVPFVGVIAGWILLGERLYPALGLGAAAILAGIVLTRSGWGRSVDAPSPAGGGAREHASPLV